MSVRCNKYSFIKTGKLKLTPLDWDIYGIGNNTVVMKINVAKGNIYKSHPWMSSSPTSMPKLQGVDWITNLMQRYLYQKLKLC